MFLVVFFSVYILYLVETTRDLWKFMVCPFYLSRVGLTNLLAALAGRLSSTFHGSWDLSPQLDTFILCIARSQPFVFASRIVNKF